MGARMGGVADRDVITAIHHLHKAIAAVEKAGETAQRLHNLLAWRNQPHDPRAGREVLVSRRTCTRMQ